MGWEDRSYPSLYCLVVLARSINLGLTLPGAPPPCSWCGRGRLGVGGTGDGRPKILMRPPGLPPSSLNPGLFLCLRMMINDIFAVAGRVLFWETKILVQVVCSI